MLGEEKQDKGTNEPQQTTDEPKVHFQSQRWTPAVDPTDGQLCDWISTRSADRENDRDVGGSSSPQRHCSFIVSVHTDDAHESRMTPTSSFASLVYKTASTDFTGARNNTAVSLGFVGKPGVCLTQRPCFNFSTQHGRPHFCSFVRRRFKGESIC